MDKKIGSIIKKSRVSEGLTQEELASLINATILGGTVKKQHVSLWETGVNKPGYYFLMVLYLKDRGWLGDMALDILRIMRPDLY